MRKFLFRITILAIIMIVVDIAVGIFFGNVYSHARGGNTARDNYICDSMNDEILIMGSSRSVRHYDAEMISRLMNATCYNCGQDANGIVLMYGRYKMLSERYHPHMIVYDVSYEYDLLAYYDNHQFLDWLRPHYDRRGIDSIFNQVDRIERFKMMSGMYRYNSKFLRVVGDYLRPSQNYRSGSSLLTGVLDYEPATDTTALFVYDSLKLSYLKRLAAETRRDGTQLVFVISPCYHCPDMKVYTPLMTICRQYSIPLFDFSHDKTFCHQRTYFHDGNHLNSVGAEIFTKKLIEKLR
jgi:hypothetical protein